MNDLKQEFEKYSTVYKDEVTDAETRLMTFEQFVKAVREQEKPIVPSSPELKQEFEEKFPEKNPDLMACYIDNPLGDYYCAKEDGENCFFADKDNFTSKENCQYWKPFICEDNRYLPSELWAWFSSKLEVERKQVWDIKEFQKNVVEWNLKNFGGHYGSGYRLILGCLEELGELSHAHLKGEQNIRHTPEEILVMKKDAIGDLMVFLLNYCDSQNIDFVECLEIVWEELQKRDWTKDKLNGKLESERDKK